MVHILQPQKTVWDSNFYSDLDIKNMCAVSIQLGGINAPVPGKAFVVQSPFGQPACIRHFATNTGSCFPLGTAGPKQVLGQACDNNDANGD